VQFRGPGFAHKRAPASVMPAGLNRTSDPVRRCPINLPVEVAPKEIKIYTPVGSAANSARIVYTSEQLLVLYLNVLTVIAAA
jgi:hypothetical protein